MIEDERALPLLGRISAFLRWLEELIVLLSGPMLVVGLGIGLVSLLSGGELLVTAPWLLYAWAISQAIGVDGQLVGTWFRVSVLIRAPQVSTGRKIIGVLFLIVLGVLLAYVAYVAALIFSMQQTYGLTVAEALARLGLDSASWLWQRAAISVFLVCLSGATRYRAPRPQATLADDRERLARQLELEPLRAQLNVMRARNVRGLASALVNRVENMPQNIIQDSSRPDAPERLSASEQVAMPPDSAEQPETPPEPPAPPDGPQAHTAAQAAADNQDRSRPVSRELRIMQGGKRRARALAPSELRKRGNATRLDGQRTQAFALLDADPALSIDDLRKAVGCRKATAQTLKQEWVYARRNERNRSQA